MGILGLASRLPFSIWSCCPRMRTPDGRTSRNQDLQQEEVGLTMSTNGRELKVLVIDDSRVSRKLVGLPLSQKQYSLIFATTGQQAMELFEKHRPALVIMDWMMPDLTGEEMCRRIPSEFAELLHLHHRPDRQGVQRGRCQCARCRGRRPSDEAFPSWRTHSASSCGRQDHRTSPADRDEEYAFGKARAHR